MCLKTEVKVQLQHSDQSGCSKASSHGLEMAERTERS